MATVYRVREGTGNERRDKGRAISLDRIDKAFPACRLGWSKGEQPINPELRVNPFSAYRFVVVHVEGGEAAGRFTKDGYWWLKGVTPADFDQKLPRT